LKIQRGQSKSHIKEQTTHCRKEKVQKEKQRSTKLIYKAKGRVTRVPLKTGMISGASDWSVDPAPLVVPSCQSS
jgi:hypothetical protein